MLACERLHVTSCVKPKLAHQRCTSLTCLTPWEGSTLLHDDSSSLKENIYIGFSFPRLTHVSSRWRLLARQSNKTKPREVMISRHNHNLTLLLAAAPRGEPASEDHHVGIVPTWLLSYSLPEAVIYNTRYYYRNFTNVN